jgi:flagellar biogenesis protein FliO
LALALAASLTVAPALAQPYDAPAPSARYEASAHGERAAALPAANPLKLELPTESPSPDGAPSAGGALSLVSVLGSLAVVLGLFFLLAWALKRATPKTSAALPASVVEPLGRAPLGPRQYVHLLRVGNKLLLVSLSPGGAETLTEITDPGEVDRLAGLCMQARSNSSSEAFRQVFQQFAKPLGEGSFAAARRAAQPPREETDG